MVGTPSQHLNGMGPPGVGASSAHMVRGRRRLTYVPGSDSSSAAGSACSCSRRKRRKQTNERSAAHEASTSSLRDRSLEKIAHDRGGRKLPPCVCWIESTTPWIAWIDDGGIVGLEIEWDVDRCRPHLGPKRGRRRGFRLLACSLLFCFSIDVSCQVHRARIDRRSIDFG